LSKNLKHLLTYDIRHICIYVLRALRDGAESQRAERHSAKFQHAELQRAEMPRGRCYKVQNDQRAALQWTEPTNC
jgi:hypothetical protein